MAKQLGTLAEIDWNAAEIELVKSITFGNTRTAVDATDNTSTAKEYLPGDEDGSLSVTFSYDPSETVQAALITDFQAGTNRTVKYRPKGDTAGFLEYEFTAQITALNFGAAHETTLEGSVDFQITGGVTVNTLT